MSTHKPFREIVKPDSNFEFVGRTRIWIVLSLFLVTGSIAMLFVNKEVRGDYLNWTIDFKGGTEIIFEFCGDPQPSQAGKPPRYKHIDHPNAAKVRSALENAGERGFEVSDFKWDGFTYCTDPSEDTEDDDLEKATGKTEKKPAGTDKKPVDLKKNPAGEKEQGDKSEVDLDTGAPKPKPEAKKPDGKKPDGKKPDAKGSGDPPPKTGAKTDPKTPARKQKKRPKGPKMMVKGMIIRTPRFGAIKKKQGRIVAAAFRAAFEVPECKDDLSKCVVLKASWSGDRMMVRTRIPISFKAAERVFKKHKLVLKPWSKMDRKRFTSKDQAGTDEYNIEFAVFGLDRQFQQILEKLLPKGGQARVYNVYGVGAKAGKKLRNDGIKSLFYAMLLIMLYLAFRFDIRYAPGAIVALIHDALLVTGVFAITWTDVSLTSVAALLTVIGYSVNDTVVIFDRIRENVGRLKDKKLPRIVNISLNETMARTLLTSITLIVVTIAMYIFGTGVVKNFAFALTIGVVVGVYSSVFIASPVLLYLDHKFYQPFSETKHGKGAKKKNK